MIMTPVQNLKTILMIIEDVVYHLLIFISKEQSKSVKAPFRYNTRIYLSLAIQRKRRCAKIPNILPCD